MKFSIIIIAAVLVWTAYAFRSNQEIPPVIIPTPISSPSPTQIPKSVINTVPFVAQAPFGDWNDLRQQEACEEASALMAMLWVRGDTTINTFAALDEILADSTYQEQVFGIYHDTSAKDTIERIFHGYYQYQNVELKNDVLVGDIISELNAGHLVLAPTNGQALSNPYYTAPGPERHMIVIHGYDIDSNEFVTNDPGTRFGHNYRYDADLFWRAIRDYPTGYNLPITGSEKNVIVVKK
ncbi:MAG: C39 family peptidase [Patescibacteria group bacterium]